MGNLFSSFDPQASVFFMTAGFNWVAAAGALLFFPPFFWLSSNQWGGTFGALTNALLMETGAVFGTLCIPGTPLLFISLFFFIVASNFCGLFPYVFTPSSHLVFTLALSLPIWVGTMTWSVVFQFKSVIAHLVPLGTPGALMPIMVVIETVSSVIRPLTLAIRLAANIIAGHLLLTLLGSQGSPILSASQGLVFVALVILLMLECAVACIQAYVFTILSSLYLNELMSANFSNNFI